jgi:demethylmenaquinone methyltransferase/2-methoxy-6-polyprenyl-1,4-benzoquinol methylase
MPFADNRFDCITIGFGFRNLIYDNPLSSVHISEMNRVLKKGGKLFILESGIPENRLIRFFYNCYLYMVLIPIGYILSGDHKAYRYLAQSSANFFTANEVLRLLSENGFASVSRKLFFIGAASLIITEKI